MVYFGDTRDLIEYVYEEKPFFMNFWKDFKIFFLIKYTFFAVFHSLNARGSSNFFYFLKMFLFPTSITKMTCIKPILAYEIRNMQK